MLTKVQWLPAAINSQTSIASESRGGTPGRTPPRQRPRLNRASRGTRVIRPGININVATRCCCPKPEGLLNAGAELGAFHIYDSRVCTWLFIYDGRLRTSAALFYLKHLSLNNEAAVNYTPDGGRKMAAPSDLNLQATFPQRRYSLNIVTLHQCKGVITLIGFLVYFALVPAE